MFKSHKYAGNLTNLTFGVISEQRKTRLRHEEKKSIDKLDGNRVSSF